MGLFSRKSSKTAQQAAEATPQEQAPVVEVAAVEEPVINVPISVTTISSKPRESAPVASVVTAAPNADGTAAAGAAAQPGPALVHHVPVEDALALWGADKNAQTMFNVLRQCASGLLLLDLHGSEFADRTKPFSPGDKIAIGSQVDNGGKKLLLVFTSNDEVSKFHNGADPLTLAQPATAILKQAVTEYEGIVINAGSPETMCIAYEPEIRQGLTNAPELNEALKRALHEKNLPWPTFVDLIAATEVVFIATKEVRNEAGELTGVTMPTIDGGDGKTMAAVFSSPAEVWAWTPGVDARATRITNVARASLNDGHSGVVLNPAGQGVLLNVSDLEKLSDESATQA